MYLNLLKFIDLRIRKFKFFFLLGCPGSLNRNIVTVVDDEFFFNSSFEA